MGRPARHREQIVAALRNSFADVLESEIKERVAVSESAEGSVSIFQSSDVNARDEFEALGQEILARIGLGQERTS